jgi:aminoglycoside phosphotransferase (APT) family kinase protein
VTPLPDTTSPPVAREILAEAFPELRITRPKLLLAGDEYDTWAVGGTVVKFPKRPEFATKLERERSIQPMLLELVGSVVPALTGLSGPVAGFPFPIATFARAVGRQGQSSEGPIMRPKPWARGALARELAGVLTALHGASVPRAKAFGVERSVLEVGGGVDVGEGAIAWASRVAGDAVDRFLIDPLPAAARRRGRQVLCHGDLKGEHVFVSEDGRRVTAVIDWADLTITDPALDLAGLAIWLGPEFVREVLDAYEGPADEGTYERAIYRAREGLLGYLDRQLAGLTSAPVPLLDAQLRAVFAA